MLHEENATPMFAPFKAHSNSAPLDLLYSKPLYSPLLCANLLNLRLPHLTLCYPTLYWTLYESLYVRSFSNKVPLTSAFCMSSCFSFQDVDIILPVVPHKAAAEVSRIGNYRRDWLLWVTDGRAKTLMDRTVQVSRWLIDELTNWLID